MKVGICIYDMKVGICNRIHNLLEGINSISADDSAKDAYNGSKDALEYALKQIKRIKSNKDVMDCMNFFANRMTTLDRDVSYIEYMLFDSSNNEYIKQKSKEADYCRSCENRYGNVLADMLNMVNARLEKNIVTEHIDADRSYDFIQYIIHFD